VAFLIAPASLPICGPDSFSSRFLFGPQGFGTGHQRSPVFVERQKAIDVDVDVLGLGPGLEAVGILAELAEVDHG